MKRTIILLLLSIIIVILLVACSSTRIPAVCPACGSTSWRMVTEVTEGYDYTKGFILSREYGAWGWLAGKGKKHKVYYCADCGFECFY